MQTYNDRWTPQMKANLKTYLDGLSEPSLGHFTPNLDFSQQAADADQDAAPDDYYYQAQGQEPPPATGYPFLGLAVLFIISWGSVAVVWAVGAYVAPPLVGWVVRMMGA